MRPINIDFIGSKPIFRPTLGWAIIAAAAFVAVLLNYLNLAEQVDDIDARLAAEERLISAERKQLVSTVEATPERINAINDAILRLNTPWNELLDTLELSLTEDVALLTINPNSAQRQLNLVAETKNPVAMTSFVSRLVEDPFLTNTILQRHRIEEGAAGRPYRFTIEASWVDQ